MARLKIIDKYILKEVVPPFLFGLAAFTSLLLVNILFTAIDYINQGIAARIVAKWVSLNIPAILVMTLPMSSLLGSLLTFGRLSGHSEITAMLAGGVSLTRIMRSLIILSFILSIATVAFNDRVVSPANIAKEQLMTGNPANTLSNIVKENFQYPIFDSSGRPRYLWMASKFNGTDFSMENVKLFEFSNTDSVKVIVAKTAAWIDNVWQFKDGYFSTLGTDDQAYADFDTHSIINNVPPREMLVEADGKPDNMTLKQLKEYMDILQRRGSDIRVLMVEYHLKIAIPFACLIFTVIGAPFGLQPNRGGSSVGLGLSIVLIFIYYVSMIVSKSMGQNGVIAPMLAAWVPNFIFMALGLFMIARKTR